MAFDFPNSPALNDTFTPAGGPTWQWNGSVWLQVAPAPAFGVYKISSGTLASAQATLDIALPAGYLSHELILNAICPVTDLQPLVLRLSNDGSTFISTGYAWANNVTPHTGVNAPGGAATATYIALMALGGQSNNSGARGSFRINLPCSPVGSVPFVFWNGGYLSGNYCSVDGNGVLSAGISGPAAAVRLLYGAGNIAAGCTWQLNGIK